MHSKYLIKVAEFFANGFHINSKTKNDWPNSFLTTDINDARVFDNIGTARGMATRLENVLKEKVGEKDFYIEDWTPITVVEVKVSLGPVVDTRELT